MNSTPSPLIFGHTLEEIADHEAAHAVVAHARGLTPRTLIVSEMSQDQFGGHVEHQHGCTPEGQVKYTRAKLLLGLAGFLAQAKGLAWRTLGPVTFAASQSWSEVASYLFPPPGEIPEPPLLSFHPENAVEGITVSTRGANDLLADLSLVGHYLVHYVSPRGRPVSEKLTVLRDGLAETAAILDQDGIWKAVQELANQVKNAVSLPTRVLNESDMAGSLSAVEVCPVND